MADGSFTLLLVLASASIISVIAAIIIYLKASKADEGEGIFVNFASNKSEKKFLGILNRIDEGNAGRLHVEYIPKDVNSKKMKGKENVGKVILETNRMDTFPKGTVSADRTVIVGYPKTMDDVPEYLKKTILGQALVYAINYKDFEKLQIKLLTEGKRNREDLLEGIGDGELTREWMSQIEELAKDSLRAAITNVKDKKDDAGFKPNFNKDGV